MSEQEQSKNVEIQIPAQELVSLLSVIQLASGRGAFRPEEFTMVGSAYEKLFSFLTDIGVLKNTGNQ
jgi:hypothetical protein